VARVGAEQRAQVAVRLAELRAGGLVTAAAVGQLADGLGVAERTVWRWLAAGEATPEPPGPAGWGLTEADRDALHAAGGNLAAAWRARQAAGAAMPSLRTFQRAVVRDLTPMERAAAALGRDGQRRHQVYLRWEAEHRNQRWEADHFQLDVLVLPPRARRPVRPWLTVFVDAYSRLVMGWALAVAPSTATVLAALRQGLALDSDRGPFGGLPGCLRPDRGLEFAAAALRQAAAALGITLLPAPPYSPHLKGKVERFGGHWLASCACCCPPPPPRPPTARRSR
jgi:putative transposase